MLAQQPRATPQHKQGALTLLPASQASRARAVRREPGGQRLQVAQVPKEFGEKKAAIPELTLEVGPEAKNRGWKDHPESPSPTLCQTP